MRMVAQVGTATARVRNEKVRSWLERLQPQLLVGGEWVPARGGETLETIDPVSEGILGVVASGTAQDVDAAVRAARTAFEEGPWSRMGPLERGKLLRRLADLLAADADELAELDSLDAGMVIGLARPLVDLAIDDIDFYAGSARVLAGHTVTSDPAHLNYTLREPFGVCGGITPWNAPLVTALTKLAPALAAGNTVVLKPAEQTPLSAIWLGELVLRAGFPAGVVNIITGFGETAGAALVDHPGVDRIGFTGSTEVGKRIWSAAASNMKRISLELGGKSPNIVFRDADLDVALPATMFGFTANTGQACCAGSRVFVEESFKDEFVEQLVKYASSSVVIGDPLDTDTTMGPVASKEQFDRVRGYLECGVAEGATARVGGSVRAGTGYFVEPTVFDGVHNSMRIAREEIFGPVVSVMSFRDEDDAITQANDTTYGLSASVWTSDITRAHTVARRIKAGTVWVNTILENQVAMPWGGYKQSGVGRDGGPTWYEDYTQEKGVIVKL